MKTNAFIDILLNWDKMSKSKKVQRLQDLENMMARFQGRKPRTITTKIQDDFVAKQIGDERDAIAFYNRGDKGKLYFIGLDMNADEAVKNLIHEGFHAYIDDFLSGRVTTLKLYSKLDIERFYIEEENLPAIHDAFKKSGMMPLYDSFYIEERLNHCENSLNMVKMIIDAIDSPMDAIKLQKFLIFALSFANENEKRGTKLERKYGVTYDSIVTNALNEDCEKEPVVKMGKIVDEMDPELLKFFTDASKLYCEYMSYVENPLMSNLAKADGMQKAGDKLLLLYRDYVMKILREKKKI